MKEIILKQGQYLERTLVDKICTPTQQAGYHKKERFAPKQLEACATVVVVIVQPGLIIGALSLYGALECNRNKHFTPQKNYSNYFSQTRPANPVPHGQVSNDIGS